MIYIGNIEILTAKSAIYLGNVGSGSKPVWIEREWDVPFWFWEQCQGHQATQSWPDSRFSVKGVGALDQSGLVLRGVHFHRQTLQALLSKEPQSEIETDEVAELESNRGRRPTYDWTVACSSVWGMLLRSELIPEVQADIEKALIAVLARGDKEPSESTVRPYAKVIFAEYSKS